MSVLAALDEVTGRSTTPHASAADVGEGQADGPAPPPPPPPSIPTVHASALSYDAFVRTYMEPGRPVLIEGATDGWGAAEQWVVPADGSPNLAALASAVPADTLIPVVACEAGRGPAGAAGKREKWSIERYAAWWAEAGHASVSPGAAAAAAPPGPPPSPRPPSPLFYAKDWHLAAQAPHVAAAAYTVPPYFADDWLNGAADAGALPPPAAAHAAPASPPAATPAPAPAPAVAPDGASYRFAYVGPAGTGTPLHIDVLSSLSWSANVAGEKAWAFLRPGHAHLATDRWGRALAPGLRPGDGPPHAFPGHASAVAATARLAQPRGAAVFVPPGWPHTVENTAAALSLNHNWTNAHAIGWMADALVRERAAAAGAIEDCRPAADTPEFEALVQRAVAGSAGLDFAGFAGLLGWGVARAAARAAASPPSAALAPGSWLFAELAADDPDVGDGKAIGARVASAAAFDARRARRAAAGLLAAVREPAGRGGGRAGLPDRGHGDPMDGLPRQAGAYADAVSAAALLAVVEGAERVMGATRWAWQRPGGSVGPAVEE